MKMLKTLVAVALVGLVGMSARSATITNVDLVKVKFNLLIQTNGDTAVKVKVISKDVLQKIANEFTNAFPGKVVPKGAVLAITGIGGTFEVFSNKTLILANANTNAAAGDGYQLNMTTKTGVITKSTETKFDEVVPTTFTYSQAGIVQTYTINGLTSLAESASTHATTFSETFSFSGSGAGTFGLTTAIVAGTVTGAGKGFLF